MKLYVAFLTAVLIFEALAISSLLRSVDTLQQIALDHDNYDRRLTNRVIRLVERVKWLEEQDDRTP